MSKCICLLIIFLTLFFVFPLKTYAVSVVINEFPSVISSDPFSVSVTVTGASAGENYLRIDLYKEGTTNYFGETFNGSDWYSGSDGKQYSKVFIPSETPYIIQGRVGDTLPNSYDGTGNYQLRIRRYTAGGNYNNDEAKASSVPITITFPTPTTIPTNLPTPTKIPTPTKVPTGTKAPSATKIPTAIPTKSAVLAVSSNITEDGLSEKEASDSSYPTPVLKNDMMASPTAKISDEKVLVKESSNNQHVAAGFLIGGGLFLAACAILVYRRIKHGKDIYNK